MNWIQLKYSNYAKDNSISSCSVWFNLNLKYIFSLSEKGWKMIEIALCYRSWESRACILYSEIYYIAAAAKFE